MPTSQHRASKKRTRATPWERPAPAKVARKRPTKLTSAQKSHAKARAKKAGRHYPNLVDNMHEAAATKKKASPKRTARKKATGQSSATKRKSTTRSPTKRTGATRKASTTGRKATKRTSTKRTSTGRKATKRTSTKRTSTKRSTKRTSTKRTSTKRSTKRAPRSGGAKKSRTRDPHGGLTAAGRAEFARKDGSHLQPGVKKRVADMSRDEMRRKGSWAVRFYGREGELPPLQDAHGEPTRFALTAAAWGEPVPKTERAARAIAARGRRLLARAKQ